MSCSSALPLAVWVLVAAATAAADPATAGVGTHVQDSSPIRGEQGAPGGQCPNFVLFTAPDGCSSCLCVVDGRMTFCSRAACPEPGNYTINECVENALYVGSDGCNSCQCNAWRSFSSCTRKICLVSNATSSPAPPPSYPPPTRPPAHTLRPPFPTQRPPLPAFSLPRPSPPPPCSDAHTPTPAPAPTERQTADRGARFWRRWFSLLGLGGAQGGQL